MGIQKLLSVNVEDKGQGKDCCHSKGHNLLRSQPLEWQESETYKMKKLRYVLFCFEGAALQF